MSVLLHHRFYLTMLATLLALLLIGLAVAYLIVGAPPRYYRTTFLEFPIPPGWDCDMNFTETICRPDWTRSSTIIILTAKYRGPMDTFESYKQHLLTPQLSVSKDPKPSQVVYVREVDLGGRRWIDGRHHGSEIANYDTRYLATTTSRIAVLATYSVHKDYFDQYEKILRATFEGMQIYENADASQFNAVAKR